jgi:hypothetical protein
MADVMDLQRKVISFQDEAKECLKLAQAEPQGAELRGPSWRGWGCWRGWGWVTQVGRLQCRCLIAAALSPVG